MGKEFDSYPPKSTPSHASARWISCNDTNEFAPVYYWKIAKVVVKHKTARFWQSCWGRDSNWMRGHRVSHNLGIHRLILHAHYLHSLAYRHGANVPLFLGRMTRDRIFILSLSYTLANRKRIYSNLIESRVHHLEYVACDPVDERDVRERLGSRSGYTEMIPLEQEFPRCKNYQSLFLSYVIKCCIADKSALNFSDPARDFLFVFTIVLAKVLLQDTLFLRYCVIIEGHVPNHEGDDESNTPIENYPPKHEDQFGNIHRVARIAVKPIGEKVWLVQFKIYSPGCLR